jgi:aspartate racemase
MKQIKIPGVLGGMGPEATLDFMSRLQRLNPATTDQDHLRLLIDHNPRVPNRHAAIAGETPSVGPLLAKMALGLEAAGADFLVMVCNTAHAFQVDIEQAVPIPFLSIIDMVLQDLIASHPDVECVGVMAADGCLEAQLYQQALKARNRRCILWSRQERQQFMNNIYRIKSGDQDQAVHDSILHLGEALRRRGADVLISGCTEIPLVIGPEDFVVPLLSSTDILVQHTVDYATGRRSLPKCNYK